MQRLQRSLSRIVKGPTGGFLASLGIAAVLGGVALATPAPPIASVTAHHPDVIVVGPLGSYPTSAGSVVSGMPSPSGGVHSDADPTGRGPATEPHGAPPGQGNDDGSAGGGRSSGGIRSAGVTPAHQDARDDPPAAGRPGQHGSGNRPSTGTHHGSGSGNGDGEHGDGSGQGSGEQQGDDGSGSSSNGSGSGNGGGSGSGDPGSGGSASGSNDREAGGGSAGGGSGNGGSGGGGSADKGNAGNAHPTRS
jgi:hypothetical protein